MRRFAEWGVLTGQELRFLCGESASAPGSAVVHDWGDGLVYFSAAEAQARGLSVQLVARLPASA